jgi:hypothetical protein
MDSDERGTLRLISAVSPPARVDHRQVKATNGIHLHVVPQVPFEISSVRSEVE